METRMPRDCRADLPDPTLMVRGIREDEFNRQTRKVKRGVFVPRTNGKDDDGLSVSEPKDDSRSMLKVRMRVSGDFFCTLSAESIRGISERGVSLDVCRAPTEYDASHSL